MVVLSPPWAPPPLPTTASLLPRRIIASQPWRAASSRIAENTSSLPAALNTLARWLSMMPTSTKARSGRAEENTSTAATALGRIGWGGELVRMKVSRAPHPARAIAAAAAARSRLIWVSGVLEGRIGWRALYANGADRLNPTDGPEHGHATGGPAHYVHSGKGNFELTVNWTTAPANKQGAHHGNFVAEKMKGDLLCTLGK